MDACPECGSCETEYLAITNCRNIGQCATITCPTAAPVAAPVTAPITAPVAATTTVPTLALKAPPSGAPYSSPTSAGDDNGERCPSELGAFKDCVATEISSADAASCESCVKDALDGLLSIARQAPTCSTGTITSALCPVLEADGECGCGACTNELRLYLSCSVDALTKGCALDCGGEPSPSPTPPSTSGAAARCRRRRIATIVAAAGTAVTAARFL
jgi:hypothetical protein